MKYVSKEACKWVKSQLTLHFFMFMLCLRIYSYLLIFDAHEIVLCAPTSFKKLIQIKRAQVFLTSTKHFSFLRTGRICFFFQGRQVHDPRFLNQFYYPLYAKFPSCKGTSKFRLGFSQDLISLLRPFLNGRTHFGTRNRLLLTRLHTIVSQCNRLRNPQPNPESDIFEARGFSENKCDICVDYRI